MSEGMLLCIGKMPVGQCFLPSWWTILPVIRRIGDPTGEPVELPGRLLRELRDSGWLTLYPAKYRLVYDYDNKI